MKTLNELYTELNSVDEKQTPAQAMQTRRQMARRMKLLAKRSSTKMKKKRMRTRRSNDALQKIAQRQAKMAVIKRSMGNVDYKELPLQKRIQIDQKIVAKKRKVIDKIAKKLLRGLKAGESKRIAKAKETQKNA